MAEKVRVRACHFWAQSVEGGVLLHPMSREAQGWLRDNAPEGPDHKYGGKRNNALFVEAAFVDGVLKVTEEAFPS